ncbi:hypothetical protein ACFXPX_20380 [Kitasatospora sp. NPDC059146]
MNIPRVSSGADVWCWPAAARSAALGKPDAARHFATLVIDRAGITL